LENRKINIALMWAKYAHGITSVNDLVLGLDRQRFNIIFIYLSGYGVERNLIKEAGYEVFYLSNVELLNAFRFSILFKLVKILKAHDVDIIHCHAHKPTVYGAIAAALARTPVVMAHVHGMGRSANLRRKLTNFLLFRRIDRIVPVAEGVRKDILRSNWLLSEQKLSVLENSVDYRRFAEVSTTKAAAKAGLSVVPANAFVFATIGRLGPYKGHAFLISAFVKVKERLPSAHLLVVGQGPLKEQLQQQVAQVGLYDSVYFLGQRDDIPRILRAIDALVLPSIASEGMPRVILEAMAARVPCVATDVGGVPEVINSDRIGWLVPSKEPHALAAAMMAVASMPKAEVEEIIEAAQDRVRRLYSHEVVRQKLLNMYESDFEARRKRT